MVCSKVIPWSQAAVPVPIPSHAKKFDQSFTGVLLTVRTVSYVLYLCTCKHEDYATKKPSKANLCRSVLLDRKLAESMCCNGGTVDEKGKTFADLPNENILASTRTTSITKLE